MIQLILHLIGDYITQSDWMAKNKTTSHKAAAIHALVYSLPFLFLSPSFAAFAIILTTHFLIDRYRLARFVIYAKNTLLHPANLHPVIPCTDKEWTEWFVKMDWGNCSATGYHKDDPTWLSVWLLIIVDNTLHLTINYLALTYL